MSELTMYVVMRAKMGWSLGAVVAQACHAVSAVLWTYKEHANVISYMQHMDNMHKVALQVFLESRTEDESQLLLSALTFGTPPLVIASRNGHFDVVRFLLVKGADVTQVGTVNFDGETIEGAPSIWAAAAAGHFDIVQLLVDSGAAVNQTTATNSSALRGACYDGHLDIVKYLVEHGADIELVNKHGHTPLMIAAYRGKLDVLQYLLSKKAIINRMSLKGNTCLHDAAEAGSVPIVKCLMAAGAAVQRDQHSITPMIAAALIGHIKVVEFFIEHESSSDVDRCSALKLLGATCVDKCRDTAAALRFWRQAVTFETDTNRDNEEQVEVHSVYGTVLEIQSMQDVQDIACDPDAIRMQALIIRERILGPKHPDTFYFLRYRGAIYADVGRYERCFELWLHALHLQQTALRPLNMMTQGTILAFAEIFGFMVKDYVAGEQPGGALQTSAPDIQQMLLVLKATIHELHRHVHGDSISLDEDPHEQTCEDCAPRDPAECCTRLLVIALYITSLLGRLSECAERSVRVDEQVLLRMLYALVQLQAPTTNLQSCLHLACNEQSNCVGRHAVTRMPSHYVVRMLLQAGADVNALDTHKQSALHVVLSNRNVRNGIVHSLLHAGAHVDQCNKDRVSCAQLMQSNATLNVPVLNYVTLQCLSARVVSTHLQHNQTLTQLIPEHLKHFVQMH